MRKKHIFKIVFVVLVSLVFIGCDAADTKKGSTYPDVNVTQQIDNNKTQTPDTNATQGALSYELQSYYADAIGKKNDKLKHALHTILKDSAIYLTYAEDYKLLAKTDKDFSKPDEDNVVLFYLQESESAENRCHSNSKNCWNREHMWPKSLGVGYDSSVNTYTDLHHLRPSDANVNAFRSNKPYGYATTPYDRIDGFYADDKFEVSDVLKGNVARAILYMTVRYEGDNDEPDLEIYAHNFSNKYPAELCTMLEWNKIDPVTDADRKRNDIVAKYQGNRNPFVDHVAWVDDIWADKCQRDQER